MKIEDIRIEHIIRDGAKLDALQDKLAVNAVERQFELHMAAISSLQQANDHGNLAFLTRLLKSFSATENVQEFLYWVHVFSDGRIRYKKDTGEFKQLSDKAVVKGNVSIEEKRTIKYKDGNGDMQSQVVRAINTPWWKLGKVEQQREKPLFDPEKDKKSLMSAIARHAKLADEQGFPELAEAYRNIEQQLVGEFNAAMRVIAKRKVEVVDEQEPEVADADNVGNQ